MSDVSELNGTNSPNESQNRTRPDSESNDVNDLNDNQHDEQTAHADVSESNDTDGFNLDRSAESANIFENQPEETSIDQVEELINNDLDPLHQNDIKVELEVLDNYSSNIDSVDQLLSSAEKDEVIQEIVVDDELTFYVGKSGYAKPTQCSIILVKRQNDVVSGDVAYKELVISFQNCFHFSCEKMKCFDYILDSSTKYVLFSYCRITVAPI